MAFRILWYDGRPYPVTGHPARHDEDASHWFVQTRDGTWHPVVERAPGTALDDVWGELEPTVRDWLAANAPSDAREAATRLTVEVTLHPPAGEPRRARSVLGGVVNTERGQCYVELATVTRGPARRAPDVVQSALNRDPAVLSVIFRTTDHPLGVHLHFDATDFLEAVVRQYLRLRPSELPIAGPRVRKRR